MLLPMSMSVAKSFVLINSVNLVLSRSHYPEYIGYSMRISPQKLHYNVYFRYNMTWKGPSSQKPSKFIAYDTRAHYSATTLIHRVWSNSLQLPPRRSGGCRFLYDHPGCPGLAGYQMYQKLALTYSQLCSQPSSAVLRNDAAKIAEAPHLLDVHSVNGIWSVQHGWLGIKPQYFRFWELISRCNPSCVMRPLHQNGIC